MSETPTINKAELLEKMDAGWGELQAFIATLSPEQMNTPTDAAGWTVKDHLMHLAVWQDGVHALLDGGDRRGTMGVPPDVWETRDFDTINASIQQNHRAMDTDAVLQHLRAVKEKFHAKVAALSEAELLRPNPGASSGTRMIQYVTSDSYEHYAEHIPWMRAIAFGSGG